VTTDHWGCAHNEARSPFRGLGLGPCAGELRYERRTIQGLLVAYWICERHQVEAERERESS
jgi:hypothetical protein